MTKLTPPLKWQDVPDFPGYQASRDGNCRRIWRDAMGFWHDKSLQPDIDSRGRRRFTLRKNNRSHKIRASRLILLTFIGPCPDGMECCHKNGKEEDDRLENLRWDTHSANLLDRRRHGTSVCGEMVNTAKLTASKVKEIRRIGKPLKQHATRHGVSEALISAILKRKVWQHVE